MERGRILIIGPNKEHTYEIRSLLDNQRFELEIALTTDVGKLVLDTRQMNLIMMHAGVIEESTLEFFQFLKERGLNIPVAVLGESAREVCSQMRLGEEVQCFEKPYDPDNLISFIKTL